MFASNSINGSHSVPEQKQKHIIIVGAGITGLLLAQSLRKYATASNSAPTFEIFERDPTPTFRGAGWGLTIHWSLDQFVDLLPKHLLDRLPETFVDPEAVERGETGNFLLYDLQTGEEKYRVPPSKRIRVSRERLRILLMEGLEIKWSKQVDTVSTNDENQTITAHFTDSSIATGTLLVGADGSRSQVRKYLCPTIADNKPLPVRLLGVSTVYTKQRCQEIRALDPFFFQATDPVTNAFFWFSFLKVPRRESSDDEVVCQILISWPFQDGFLGKPEASDTPESNVERVQFMKQVADGWVEPFRSIVHDIPDLEDVKAIKLEDWVPEIGIWENRTGRITLLGDAAHPMTMYRGEGANHGIADVFSLYTQLTEPFLDHVEAINNYEAEMIPRAKVAVLTSRRACLDAHDSKSINEKSPLVAKRVMIFE